MIKICCPAVPPFIIINQSVRAYTIPIPEDFVVTKASNILCALSGLSICRSIIRAGREEAAIAIDRYIATPGQALGLAGCHRSLGRRFRTRGRMSQTRSMQHCSRALHQAFVAAAIERCEAVILAGAGRPFQSRYWYQTCPDRPRGNLSASEEVGPPSQCKLVS